MSVAGRNLWFLVGGVFCILAVVGVLAFLIAVAI
jgi:hypothetical protein